MPFVHTVGEERDQGQSSLSKSTFGRSPEERNRLKRGVRSGAYWTQAWRSMWSWEVRPWACAVLRRAFRFLQDTAESAWANLTQTSCDGVTAADIWVALENSKILLRICFVTLSSLNFLPNLLKRIVLILLLLNCHPQALWGDAREEQNKQENQIKEERNNWSNRINWQSAHNN